MSQSAAQDKIHHDLAGEDILSKSDARFAKYRERWQSNPAKREPGSFPLHLDIELTSLCNLSCPFCATPFSRHKLPQGNMDPLLAKRLLDEGGEHGLCACKFNFRGEPLLHPKLPELVAHAKKRGLLDVFFNTNATLLDEAKARALIDAGLDRVTISLEGCDKESYERSRVGAVFERTLANVEGLMALRAKLGATHPKVRVQAVLTPEMSANLERFVSFWSARVDQVSVNEMLDNTPGSVPEFESGWVCPFPYQRMMVMWDGRVTTCYNDHYAKNSPGRAQAKSLAAFWREDFARIRELHLNGRALELGACRECPLRMHESRKLASAQAK